MKNAEHTRSGLFHLSQSRSSVWSLHCKAVANYNSQIPFYNTVKQWRTLQKHALTSVDLPNTEFSLSSSFITEALLNSLSTIFQAHHHSVRQRTEGGKHGVSSRQTVLLKDKVLPSQGTKQTSYHMQSLLMHKQQGKTCFTQTPNFSGTSALSQKLFLQSFLAKTLGHTKTWSSETSDFHTPAWTRQFCPPRAKRHHLSVS